jgi:hypothetical protein
MRRFPRGWIVGVCLLLVWGAAVKSETFRHEGVRGECWLPDDWVPVSAAELRELNQEVLRTDPGTGQGWTAVYRWNDNDDVRVAIKASKQAHPSGSYEDMERGLVMGVERNLAFARPLSLVPGFKRDPEDGKVRFDRERQRVTYRESFVQEGELFRETTAIYLCARGAFTVKAAAPAKVFPEVEATLQKVVDSVQFAPGYEFKWVAQPGQAEDRSVVILLVVGVTVVLLLVFVLFYWERLWPSKRPE